MRPGLALAAAGCAPFAAGALLPRDLGGPACPFAAVTGLPCPLCGGTRAFVGLMHGDAWTQFGAGWVVVAALAVLLGALLAVGAVRVPARVRVRGPAWTVGLIVAVAAGPWAWALAHRDTIVV